MAYYCGECVVWLGSSDSNSYGERWCPYSRRYEKSDQNIYGCNGFVYVGRAIITYVCQILNQDATSLFANFDMAKENYLVPCHMNQLVSYCEIGPQIVQRMNEDENRGELAQYIMDTYLKRAQEMCEGRNFSGAVQHYVQMIDFLKEEYQM